MTVNQTALERAFEIARTGGCNTVDDIRRQLSREGFEWRQVEGRTLYRQLQDTLRKTREAKAAL